jgi:hypothetical protein
MHHPFPGISRFVTSNHFTREKGFKAALWPDPEKVFLRHAGAKIAQTTNQTY